MIAIIPILLALFATVTLSSSPRERRISRRRDSTSDCQKVVKKFNGFTSIGELGKQGSPDADFTVDPNKMPGKGAYGDVYAVTCKKGKGKIFAMKYVSCKFSAVTQQV